MVHKKEVPMLKNVRKFRHEFLQPKKVCRCLLFQMLVCIP